MNQLDKNLANTYNEHYNLANTIVDPNSLLNKLYVVKKPQAILLKCKIATLVNIRNGVATPDQCYHVSI